MIGRRKFIGAARRRGGRMAARRAGAAAAGRCHVVGSRFDRQHRPRATRANLVAGLRRGLREAGLCRRARMSSLVECRWAGGQARCGSPALAADLVRPAGVDVIVGERGGRRRRSGEEPRPPPIPIVFGWSPPTRSGTGLVAQSLASARAATRPDITPMARPTLGGKAASRFITASSFPPPGPWPSWSIADQPATRAAAERPARRGGSARVAAHRLIRQERAGVRRRLCRTARGSGRRR